MMLAPAKKRERQQRRRIGNIKVDKRQIKT